ACGLAYSDFFDRYGIFLPRKVVHNEFYWPARLDDRLRVAAYVGRVGTSSMTLNFDVLRHGSPSLGAAGWMVLVCVGRGDLKPRPCGRPGALVAHGSSGGNGVLLWLRYGDSLTSGDYPVLVRGDTATSHGPVAAVRFMTGPLTHGTALDSGVVTVSRARDRLTARARGSGPEVGGARRARVEADFEALVIGGGTVSC